VLTETAADDRRSPAPTEIAADDRADTGASTGSTEIPAEDLRSPDVCRSITGFTGTGRARADPEDNPSSDRRLFVGSDGRVAPFGDFACFGCSSPSLNCNTDVDPIDSAASTPRDGRNGSSEYPIRISSVRHGTRVDLSLYGVAFATGVLGAGFGVG
jgi:hypothetical protein